MAFWNRKKQADTSELPEEVREYYASTKRTRGFSTWLMGLATLILTLLIAVALYFAGKFMWNQFFNNEPDTTTTEQTTLNEQPEQPAQDNNDTTENTENNNQNQAQDEPRTLPGDNNDQPESETDTSANNVNGTSTNLESTPETGPGDTIAIFAGTVVLATLGYEILARKKQIS